MKRIVIACALFACAANTLGAAAGVTLDRLGFPVYVHARLRGETATNAGYTTKDDFDTIVAWYKTHAGRDWIITPPARSSLNSGDRSAEFRFDNAAGTHTIVVSQGNIDPLVTIVEILATPQAVAAERDAAWRRAHPPGGVDELGLPIYPNVVVAKGSHAAPPWVGTASYATPDDLPTVVAWYAPRLGALGYAVAPRQPDSIRRVGIGTAVFYKGSDTVVVTRQDTHSRTLIFESIRKRQANPLGER